MPRWKTRMRCNCGRTFVQTTTDKLCARINKQERKGLCHRCTKEISTMIDSVFGKSK